MKVEIKFRLECKLRFWNRASRRSWGFQLPRAFPQKKIQVSRISLHRSVVPFSSRTFNFRQNGAYPIFSLLNGKGKAVLYKCRLKRSDGRRFWLDFKSRLGITPNPDLVRPKNNLRPAVWNCQRAPPWFPEVISLSEDPALLGREGWECEQRLGRGILSQTFAAHKSERALKTWARFLEARLG